MKKILTSIVLTLAIFIGITNAQTTNKEIKKAEPTTKNDSMLVATVNIYNATNTDMGNNTYKVSFQIYNRVGIQSNIRYGLQLVTASGSAVTDTQLSNEALTLGERDSRNLEMTYSVPGFIPNGEYKLVIVAQNQNGLPLAYMPAGFPERIIKVNKSIYSLGVEECSLKVLNNASGSISYKAMQGVDILPTENLIATCIVKNDGNINLNNLKFSLITHKRDQFGDILSRDVSDKIFSVKSKSSQTVEFTLPVLKNPQAYDVDTFLINNSGEKISPSTRIHYVVSGPSATIQNSILDKTSYKKGDVANLELFWTPAADTFYGSRLGGTKNTYLAQAEIRDISNNICGTATKTLSTSNSLNKELLKIAINNDCPNAIASVKITDDKGNVLDSVNIDLNNPVQKVDIDSGANSLLSKIGNISKVYIVIFVLVLALIAYGILVLRKKED